MDNRIDGAVLTLIDIGASKLYQRQIERSREQLLHTVDLMQQPVIVIDEQMHVKTANQAFYRAFGLQPAGVVGKPMMDLAHAGWDVERLKALSSQLYDQPTTVQHFPLKGPGSMAGLFANSKQFPLEDGKHWTVLALTVANGDG